MKIVVGTIEQKILANNDVSAKEVADFLDSLMLIPHIESKLHEAINDLRIYYGSHGSASFIEDTKYAKKHYEQTKKKVIEALNNLSKESTEKNKAYIDSILQNFHYSDKVLNKGGFLGKLIRLSQHPD